MFSHILVPCDISYAHSAWLAPTITAACDFANKYGSRLHFMTVVPDNMLKGFYPSIYDENLVEEARERLARIVAEHAPSGTVHDIHVRKGGICSEIIHMAREVPADLIVLASHGPILMDYLLGSNASHVALHAPCSVFILRGKSDATLSAHT